MIVAYINVVLPMPIILTVEIPSTTVLLYPFSPKGVVMNLQFAVRAVSLNDISRTLDTRNIAIRYYLLFQTFLLSKYVSSYFSKAISLFSNSLHKRTKNLLTSFIAHNSIHVQLTGKFQTRSKFMILFLFVSVFTLTTERIYKLKSPLKGFSLYARS